MHGDGGEPAVMTGHDTEALEERLSVVKGGLAFLGIVSNDHVEVMERYVFPSGSLHDTDTPVDIGRITVAKVIGCGDGEVSTGVEGLMTDEHAVAERLPGKVLRWSKTTMMKETAFRIHDVSVAVKNGREVTQRTVPCVTCGSRNDS